MPKLFQFREGSLIYFQGDAANAVHLLQSGKITLNYQDIETGEDMHDPVSPGEFFGVKSALGRYPREENAIATQNTTVVAFTIPEFESLAQANTRIIMKMLKVFSNQLRRIHKQVSNIVKQTENEIDAEAGLFNVGEYYLKNKRFPQAKYVFSRYLTYYPSGRSAAQAAKNLEAIETAAHQTGLKNQTEAASSSKTDASSLSTVNPSSNLSDWAKAYYDAVSLISQEKYQQAYLALKKIIDTSEDPEYTAKSSYELGRCLFLFKKYDECIKYFTGMITKYPRHPDLGNSLYFMGQSYEKLNEKDQALVFYKKILTLTEGDETVQAKAIRALKAATGKGE